MDHPMVPVVYETFESTGPNGTAMADANAFLRTRPDQPTPDVQAELVNVVYPTAAAGRVLPDHGFTIFTMLMHPLSRGTVTLRSTNPFDLPLANPNFYMEPADLENLIDSIEQVRHIGAQPALTSVVKGEARPGQDLTSREQLRQYARATTTSSYHPSGTAKMGVDNLAVVDPELRVHGVEGLRVADLSVIPTLTTGNTNAPAMMIGERAADFILRS
jgi:choline dehydrogenase